MKYNKIEALLKLKNMSMSDFARYKNVSRQQISNKKKTDTFRADELIEVALLTNTKLAFIDENNNPVIVFGENDIKKDTFSN